MRFGKRSAAVLVITAIVLKLGLWFITTSYAPHGKFENDTDWYLQGGEAIASEGRFIIYNEDGHSFRYEMFRTPGYPFFLGALKVWLKFPLEAVLLVQIALTIAAAALIYNALKSINPRLAGIAGFIVLFDPAITVFSLMLMTESLFIFFMALFFFFYLKYLSGHALRHLLFAAFSLAAAAYVRPIAYFLGAGAALFTVYAFGFRAWKKALVHAIVFFIAFYSLIGIWHYRNYRHNGVNRFSTISGATVNYAGIYKSYSRNEDKISKGLPPWAYYANTFSRSLLSLMTRTETYKYWGIKPLTVTGKIFGYPWMVFWVIGLVAGLARMNGDKRLHLAVFIIMYFIITTIGGAFWGASARFRAPMMPFIAVVSAYGWMTITHTITKNRRVNYKRTAG